MHKYRATITYHAVVEAESPARAIAAARALHLEGTTEPKGISVRRVLPEEEAARMQGKLIDLADRLGDDGHHEAAKDVLRVLEEWRE